MSWASAFCTCLSWCAPSMRASTGVTTRLAHELAAGSPAAAAEDAEAEARGDAEAEARGEAEAEARGEPRGEMLAELSPSDALAAALSERGRALHSLPPPLWLPGCSRLPWSLL